MAAQFQSHTLAVQHEGKVYYVHLEDKVWPIIMAMICSVSKDQKLQLVEAPKGTKIVNLLEVE